MRFSAVVAAAGALLAGGALAVAGVLTGAASPTETELQRATDRLVATSGAIVSNAHDLAVFFGALLRGKLVPRGLVAQMEQVVPRSHGEGMGVYRLPSPCGRWFYGHTGGTPGYVTFAAGTRDGRHLFVVDWNGVGSSAIEAMDAYLDELICR